MTGLPRGDAARIEKLFRRAGLPTRLHLSGRQSKRLLDAMLLDKKVTAGEVKFVLASALGRVEPGHKVAADLILETLAHDLWPLSAKTLSANTSSCTGFLVRQDRKHVPRTKREGDSIDFFIWNPQPQPPRPFPPSS